MAIKLKPVPLNFHITLIHYGIKTLTDIPSRHSLLPR